ncbi:SubName: Full=Uncharacterized protein {ECO:0000313/EMBL:CCA77484.1} [Serendipita indica DSM 11827]|uniref:Uncharacterized protein n=1 Tax=Serendipita indica (strain DSM 11827) TaxID=1109443 RepID=G4U1P1_SERID|nr:SubName: Full=Uncharacterized protein {ECO:0000313/EMBL:CCA77484.1} [Serendipita indica DSM 11827]CCA77484.1 hypothetical protein PIIN_11461 [Serendipita indica DSM 11827]
MENPFDHPQDQYPPRQNQSGSPWNANNPNNTGAPPPPPRPPSNPAPNNQGAYSQGSYPPYSAGGAGYGYNSDMSTFAMTIPTEDTTTNPHTIIPTACSHPPAKLSPISPSIKIQAHSLHLEVNTRACTTDMFTFPSLTPGHGGGGGRYDSAPTPFSGASKLGVLGNNNGRPYSTVNPDRYNSPAPPGNRHSLPRRL